MEERRKARQHRKFRQNKTEIIKAFSRVLSARGTASITMEEVAREAGFSIGSLYNYFPSKEALAVEYLTWLHDAFLDSMRVRVPEGTPFPARIRFTLSTVFELMERERDAFLSAFYLPTILGEHTPHFENIREIYIKNRGISEDMLQFGVAEGYIRQENLRQQTIYFQGLMRAVIESWIMVGSPVHLVDAIPGLVEFFLKGAGD